MNRFHDKHARGVTLLEVMACIAIVGVLASIATPHYIRYKKRARAAVCASNRYQIEMEDLMTPSVLLAD